MKTISVREAAQALGLSKRAVIYRIESGKLSATRTKNSSGVEEYRIYPNKELIDLLTRAAAKDPLVEVGEEVEALYEDIHDAEAIPVGTEETEALVNDLAIERERMRLLAEEFMRPLVEKLAAQTQALAERDQLIEERERLIEQQNRQLRLLPDFQKRAEEERKAAELKELEAEALRKQIAALQAEQSETERALLETQRVAQEEIEQLRQEKEAQARVVQEKLHTLSATVEQLQVPWWKKMFMAREV